MIILDTPAAMRAWTDEQRSLGRRISLVPTMGALHAGHAALVHAATECSDAVIVSIFVNPLQFNRVDDFELYPRPIDADIDTCTGLGVDVVYAPTAAAMYPSGFETHVEPGSLAEPMEGAGRPGHFRGVTTVVAKLFNATRPDVAVFGRKDFQQLAVITRMVTDLDLGIEIVGLDTVREPDGLAMSSRNRRLDADQRAAAVVLPRALAAAADHHADGPDGMRRAALAIIDGEPLARLEYLEIVDPHTLGHPPRIDGDVVVLAAVWFGEVRLIDNRSVSRRADEDGRG
jgi:pantoate--beta-alanine ligase